MFVFGTRPEAIKMCPVILEMKKLKEFHVIVTVTGQHREMLDQVLAEFQVIPDYDLAIMRDRQSLTEMTSHILHELGKVLLLEKPDLLLVHGDTTTTFSAALAAFYHHIRLGHIEAGLRTNDKYSPFPEEMNRRLVGELTDLHFSPTRTAKENLLREGKREDSIFVTGNTVIDALKYTVSETFKHPILEKIYVQERRSQEKQRMILLTVHRRENQGNGMKNIFRAVCRIVKQYKNTHIVFPVHLNPMIQKIAHEMLEAQERIYLIPPLDVLPFHNFESRAFMILTDSGGVQEEAPYFGVPVLVLRDNTERPEGVAAGTLRLVGADEEKIYQVACDLMTNAETYSRMARSVNPYGDGHASERIVKIIKNQLEMKS
ncbi:MAG: non-hydrolyzing UDP-N-acetylglucosamine 2-epimerase [Sporolactobacillus sp.]